MCPTAAALTPLGVAARLLVSNEAADGDSQSPHPPTIVGDAGGKVSPPGTAAA
jgi:hypothetical protein